MDSKSRLLLNENKEEDPSLIQAKRSDLPAPKCVSKRRSESLHRTTDFGDKDRGSQRPDSPEPSCVSQSNRSMNKSINLKAETAGIARELQRHENRGRDRTTRATRQKQQELTFQEEELEHNVITLVKKELKRYSNILNPRFSVGYEDEVKTEDDKSVVRDGVLKIVLHVLKKTNQSDVAKTLQNNLAFQCRKPFQLKLKLKFEKTDEGICQYGTSRFLNEMYTEIYMIEGWSDQISSEHEVRQIEKVSWRQAREKKLIKCNDLFKDRATKTVLTKGVAGIGKTVSVQKFILDWVEGKANQDILFIFPLPFRELHLIKKYLSLMSLLHHMFPEIKELDSIDCQANKVLFIFDGLDECRLPLNFQNNKNLGDVTEFASLDVIFTNLIKGNLLPSALIWITTRPGAASQIPPECVSQATEFRGFTNSQKDEYFRKNVKDRRLAEEIIKHIRTTRSLHVMCYIPVFCWISASVLEKMLTRAEGQRIPKTVTQLFTNFLIYQIKHKGQKYHGTSDHDPHQIRESILALGQLAFQQLEKGNLIFYEEDLKGCGIDVREASVYSGLCTRIFRQDCNLNLGKVFSFVHLSVQEFLAALFVFLFVVNKNVPAPKSTDLLGLFNKSELSHIFKYAVDEALKRENGHLDLFLRFLLGISEESNQMLIRDLLPETGIVFYKQKNIVRYIKKKLITNLPPEKTINLFHCLSEINENTIDQQIQVYVKDRRHNLSSDEKIKLLQVLLSLEVEDFDLRMYSRSEEGLQWLLPVVHQTTRALLCGCFLTEQSCEALASVLSSKSSNLKKLDLSENDLYDSGVIHLCGGLKNPNCKLDTLWLERCRISDAGCEALASTLRSNPLSELRELNLNRNNPEESGVKELSDLLKDPRCKLKILSIEIDPVNLEKTRNAHPCNDYLFIGPSMWTTKRHECLPICEIKQFTSKKKTKEEEEED